ncbi:MAG TPA: protease inhibitor I42 family protein [Azonexus sp.]|nr:protease inhibitor I42 family protein [Azonexus sp.]
MRIRSLAWLTVLAGACLMHAASAVTFPNSEPDPRAMLTIGESDNGRTLDIGCGESVRVSLPENATTGYRWAIDRYDERVIEAIASEAAYPAGTPGSGGEVAFTLRGKNVGSGEVTLKYWRHWEGESSVRARFQVRLNVHP